MSNSLFNHTRPGLPRTSSRCGPAVIAVRHWCSHSRRTVAPLSAALRDQETQTRKNAMPVLPTRKKSQQAPEAPEKTEDKSTSSRNLASSSSSGGGGGGSRDRKSSSRQQQPGVPPLGIAENIMQERALAGLLAYTGMMGTVATAAGFLVPGLDLFGNFHLYQNDMLLAVKLMVPVYLANVLIMWPNYSSWQLPEPSAESRQRVAEALVKWSSRQASRAAAANGSSSDSSSGTDAPAAEESSKQAATAAAYGTPSTAVNASSNISETNPGPLPQGQTTDESSNSSSSSSSSSNVSSSWLQAQVSQSPVLSRAKDALFLAQGHYLSRNPALVLPPSVQVTVLLVECLAAELMYRSVTLQLGGGWISDRLVEAGADDFLAAVTAGLPVQPGTHMGGQLIAIALLSGVWGVMVLQRVVAWRRPPVMALQGQASRETAEQLLQEVRSKDKKRQRQQQQHDDDKSTMMENASRMEATSSSSSSHKQDVTAAETSGWQQEEVSSLQQRQQQQQNHLAAPDSRPQQQQPEFDHQLHHQEWQWAGRAAPRTLSALSLSQLIQGARDITQTSALGLGFVLTGNLAASFTAAVINQLLLLVLQQHAMERAHEKRRAIAAQLAGLARQMRDIQRKQLESKRQQQQHAGMSQQQQQPPPSVATQDHRQEVTQVAVQHDAVGSSSASAPQDAAAMISAAGQHHAADIPQPSPDEEAAATRVLGNEMKRTISILDMLLGDQVGEHATAGPGPHSSGK